MLSNVLAILALLVVAAYAESSVKATELESKAGSDVQIACGTQSNDTIVTGVKWELGGKEITASSKYVFEPAEGIALILKLTDVNFDDRNTYRCIADVANGTITTDITLRVRDPLGVLWPFLGIIVEAILLFIILSAHEYMGGKSGSK